MSVPEPPKYVGSNMCTRMFSVDPIHKPRIRFPSLRARGGEKERDREKEREREGEGQGGSPYTLNAQPKFQVVFYIEDETDLGDEQAEWGLGWRNHAA